MAHKGYPDNPETSSKVKVYVNYGVQESTSDDSLASTSVACNDNDIPLSGAYSIVREDEDEENGEINEIENI